MACLRTRTPARRTASASTAASAAATGSVRFDTGGGASVAVLVEAGAVEAEPVAIAATRAAAKVAVRDGAAPAT